MNGTTLAERRRRALWRTLRWSAGLLLVAVLLGMRWDPWDHLVERFRGEVEQLGDGFEQSLAAVLAEGDQS